MKLTYLTASLIIISEKTLFQLNINLHNYKSLRYNKSEKYINFIAIKLYYYLDALLYMIYAIIISFTRLVCRLHIYKRRLYMILLYYAVIFNI